MPAVNVRRGLLAPPDGVWRTVVAIDDYPRHMSHVRSIEVVEHVGNRRVSTWEVLLRGSVLRWTEVGTIDADRQVITFEQLDGDLSEFRGSWSVSSDGPPTQVEVHIEFEIGIPLLADMLNPIARRSLDENLNTMLDAIETQSANGPLGPLVVDPTAADPFGRPT